MHAPPPSEPSAFFINLCVDGKLVPLTQGELLQFFQVHFAATNQVPDDLPEVQELLQRGRRFYEQDQDPQNEPARQSNRAKCSHIPPAGTAVMPDFLYLKPIEISGVLQMGLFTVQPLPSGTWIGIYTGRLLPGACPSRSLYVILFEDAAAGVTLKIDAQHDGNHVRFMNHSEQPNVKPTPLFYQGMCHVAMMTIRAVEAHQQLVYDYSKPYWEQLGVTPEAL